MEQPFRHKENYRGVATFVTSDLSYGTYNLVVTATDGMVSTIRPAHFIVNGIPSAPKTPLPVSLRTLHPA